MLLLWYFSLIISIVSFLAGIHKKSWLSLFLSTITSLPIAYYFLGAENAWRFVGFIPLFLLILTIITWLNNKPLKEGN